MSVDPNRWRVRDEIEHHLAELRSQLEAEGLSPDEARNEAARRFGDPDRIARETRIGASRWERMRERVRAVLDAIRQDLSFALRQLLREPVMTGLTLATLAIGVSATTIVFAVVHAVVLKPIPFADPDRVVHIGQTSPQGQRYSTSEPNFIDFRARQRSFTDMAALGSTRPILSGTAEAEGVDGLRVSHSLFDLVGMEPVLGRGFAPDEDRFGGANEVVVLSEGAWRRRYGADPDIVGTALVLDGAAHRVVGVAPSDRVWPGVEVFTPLAPNPDGFRDDHMIETVARLAPGVTIIEAQRDLTEIAARLSAEFPQSNEGWGAYVRSAREWRVGASLERLGRLLLGAVALFLIMTCASVSNLLLARASARGREVSVRSALGAGRGRIMGQLMAEGSVLALVGGATALLLSLQGLSVVRALGPGDVARLHEASVSGPVLGVALLASLLTVLAAGSAPAILLDRRAMAGTLRSPRFDGESTRRIRDTLVVLQFTLAVAVVSGAALLTRSFVQLQDVDLGFEASGLVRFAVRLPGEQFDVAGRAAYLQRLQEGVAAVPGVSSVGVSTVPPFGRFRPSNFVARSDDEPDRREDFTPVSWRAVSGDFFVAAGIQLLAGRVFGPQDHAEREEPLRNPPVVIDRALADALWPAGDNPIGRFVTWFAPGGQQCEVIGVVASARDERVDAEPRPRIYRPLGFTTWEEPTVLVRTDGDPGRVVPALRRAALAVDPSVPAIAPTPVSDDLHETVAWPRFSMQVLSLFGLVALALAAMGIYGVTAFSVERRRHEMGIRVALGAEPAGVQWMMVRRGLWLAMVGIGLGLPLAMSLARLLGALLYGVSPTDPTTFLLVPATLWIVALAATWIPARRALGLDPAQALVSE